jgi:hypothetical protein
MHCIIAFWVMRLKGTELLHATRACYHWTGLLFGNVAVHTYTVKTWVSRMPLVAKQQVRVRILSCI